MNNILTSGGLKCVSIRVELHGKLGASANMNYSFIYLANIYLLKVNNRNTKKGVKYVRS